MMLTAGLEFGVDAGGGVRRFTSNTNGGPVFVYVRDGRILRITPIEFDEDDAESWTIEARGAVVHAAAQDHGQLAHARLEVARSTPRTGCSTR